MEGRREMKIPDSMPALPRLPELPPPRENMETMETRFKEAYEAFRQGRMHRLALETRTAAAVTKWVTGENGWSATLFGTFPGHLSMQTPTAYALRPLLEPLGEWWLSAVERAVRECPEPENAARRKKNSRALNNASQQFDMSGPLRQTSGRGEPLRVDLTLQFNGTALIRDTVWPFNPHLIGRTLMEALKEALGDVPVWQERKSILSYQPAWDPASFWTRREPKNLRIFEDFSGTPPEERGVLDGPGYALHATEAWPDTTHWLSREICDGSGCRREPGHEPTGCDGPWHRHSQAVFQAFRANNPELHYRENNACIAGTVQRNHTCRARNHSPVRGLLLDHDETCRFTDGEKIIISHPYLDEAGDDPVETPEKWKELGVETRNAGKDRSWYFPGHSSLVFVGKREILDRLTMDFPVPQDTAPAGCVRWQADR